MELNWTMLASLGLLNDEAYTLAARLHPYPNVYLTNLKLSTNAARTIILGSNPDSPLVAGRGLYLFDSGTYRNFPYGATVDPPT